MGNAYQRKPLLKIIAATSVTIFSLFSVCVGAFAWFATIREHNSTSDDFVVTNVITSISSIKIYQYLGESVEEDGTTYFGFNPTPYGEFGVDGDQVTVTSGNPSIELDQYSVDDPHHPCLVLFETSERSTRVVAQTLKPFLPQSKPGSDTLPASNIVANYAALEAKKAGATDGEIFEVTNDEHHAAEYEEYIDDHAVREYVTTRYSYNAENDDFDFIWTDLGLYNNPLSSIVQFNWFIWEDIPEATNKDLYLYELDAFGMKVRKRTPESTSCIPVDRSGMDEEGDSSFISFSGDTANFEQETIIFDGGDVDSETTFNYVGVVIDYNQLALEYLFSYYIGHPFLSDGLTFKCDWTTYL